MPISDKFVLRRISLSNYYSDNEKVSGTVEIQHKGSDTKMEFRLEPDDVAVILDLLGERVAQSIRSTSHQLQVDTGVLQLEAEQEEKKEEKPSVIDVEGSEAENFTYEEDQDFCDKPLDDDEIPF